MQLKCPTCKTNKGELHPQFGLIACKKCRTREQPISERTYEVVPDRIKEQYKSHKKQTIQPFRNGQVSKEYIEEYGTKHIEVTDEEVKNSKYVWNDLDYYKQ